MGHGQITDYGLPISESVECIELALRQGVPVFLQTLDVVLSEQQVEEVVMAKELAEVSPDMYAQPYGSSYRAGVRAEAS